jgi:60 kDa SS-A/Ro ribonucleoprotein
MPSYLKGAATPRQTPQSQPIPGTSQIENSAGGFVWGIDSLARLRRFLILGAAGGTYYVGEASHLADNVQAIRVALDEHGTKAVEQIVHVSNGGLAPHNDEAIYALAVAAGHPDEQVRKAALTAIPVVCRIGTHLFMFCEFLKGQRGWGRALKKAIAAWYLDKDPDALAYQLVKYRQREGWTHADVLRKCKPGSEGQLVSEDHDALFRFATKGEVQADDTGADAVNGYLLAQQAETPRDTVDLIRLYGNRLPREALQPKHLTDPGVLREQLAQGMPMTALIRNLGNLTRHGVLKPMSPETAKVTERITNQEAIRKARVHPIAVLAALLTYQSGHGVRGSGEWDPVREVVDALDAAFYFAFENVPKTGKRQMLALDVSGSMAWGEIARVPGLTPRVGSAAMALITAASGDPYMTFGFSDVFVPLTISPRERLDDALRTVSGLPFAGTDCALPMLYALERGLGVDVFTIYTDNETWAGGIHPAQALRQYRERTGIDARLIVVGMTATDFSIADPNDAGMMDIVGFDAGAPTLMAEFAAGRL